MKPLKIIFTLFKVLLPYFIISTLSVFIVFVGFTFIVNDATALIIIYLIINLLMICFYFFILHLHDKFDELFYKINCMYIILTGIVFTITFLIVQGSLTHPILNINYVLIFPLFPVLLISSLMWNNYGAIIMIGIILVASLFITLLFSKKYKLLPLALIYTIVIVACGTMTYLNSPNYKYKGHGFEYMHGFSSVDLSDYTVYSDSNSLVTLDHEVDLMIEDDDKMPILDGAEACFPVYSAIAKAVYKDIDIIEKEYEDTPINGKIVTFTNTAYGYERLFNGEIDMFFGAKPSQSQLEMANELGIELEYTLIGKEAFVFFVNENNPINSLTSDEIRKIYHGDIVNFKEVGGNNEIIVAFQRPERSGSQAMMQYFMGDISLKEPITYEMQYAMAGIISEVADYYNEDGAIGYTFRYFLEGLNQEENVKILSVDDVYPTNEAIISGEYPIVAGFYCVTVKGNDNEYIDDMIDFLLSEDGQYIIEKTGYIPLK